MAASFPPQLPADTWWHICWQVAQGRSLVADALLVERIRNRLIQAHVAPGRALLDYVLTPSEMHVISCLSATESPGDIAREVANVVARWVRQTAALRGPVFAGPYRSHRLESREHLRQELRMLAWRPVVLGLCRTPLHHPHSALRATLGLRPAKGYDARPLLALFAESVPLARLAVRSLVSRRPPVSDARRWELARGLALATGSVGPQSAMAREVRGAAAALVAAAWPDGIDGALWLLETWVLAKLGVLASVDLQVATDAPSARARALVACLAVDHGLCSAASVARHFRRAKATLSEQMATCRGRSADQQILSTPASRILDEATALPRRQR